MIKPYLKGLFIGLMLISSYYSQIENPKLSVKDNERIIQQSNKQTLLKQLALKNEDTSKVVTLLYLARTLNAEGDPDSAVMLLSKCSRLSFKLSNYWGQIHSNCDLGLILLDQGKYNESLKSFLEAQKLSQLEQDSLGMAHVQLLIGNLRIRTSDTKGALDCFEKSLKIYLKLSNQKGISQSYYKIATVYNIRNESDRALHYFNKAIELFKEQQDSIFLANCYGDLAIIYDEKKDFDKAEEYYLDAIDIVKNNNDAHTLTRLYHNLAYSYYMQKKFDKSLSVSNTCSSLAKQAKLKELIMANEALLSSLYEKKQDYKQAFEHFRIAEQYSDSLNTQELSNEILRIENRANIENEKAKLRSEQEKKDILVKEEIKIQRIITAASIAGVILVIALAFSLILGYRRKIKADKLLSEINSRIANMQGQEMERERMARELHDGIGGSLATLKLNLSNYISNHQSNELVQMKNLIGEIGKEVRTISHNLMPVAISESNINELLESLVNKYNTLNRIEIKYECLTSLHLNNLNEEVKRELYRVVQELFHNAFKYSRAKEIHLDLFMEDGTLVLQMEDNGIGFDTTRQTQGIGLRNVSNRIKQLNGQISIVSKPNKGTAISIQIPTSLNNE